MINSQNILNRFRGQKFTFTRDSGMYRLEETYTLEAVTDEYLVFKDVSEPHSHVLRNHAFLEPTLISWLQDHLDTSSNPISQDLIINWRLKSSEVETFKKMFISDYDYSANYIEDGDMYTGSIAFDLNCSNYQIQPYQNLGDQSEYMEFDLSNIVLRYCKTKEFRIRPVQYPFAKTEYVLQSEGHTIYSYQYLTSTQRFQSEYANLYLDTCHYFAEEYPVSNRNAVLFFADFLLKTSSVGCHQPYVLRNAINFPASSLEEQAHD